MKSENTTAPDSRRQLGETLKLFARNEDGVITIFACYIIVLMVLVGGIGVDLMHNEMQRTKIQNISDRAVLAAADLDQRLPPAEVVADYFAKSGLTEFLDPSHVNVDPGLNYRTVTITTSGATPTMFMRMLGVDELLIPVKSQAEEKVPNVEVSLVLDISGSMRDSNRMNDLRPAAKSFISAVLAGDNKKTTSISIIPYAGQTNPGPFMFNRLNGKRFPTIALDEAQGGIPEADSNGPLLPNGVSGGTGSLAGVRYVFPNDSSCLDVSPSGFDDSKLPSGALYDQTPVFMNWKIASNVMDWGWCPRDQTQIKYFSNNEIELNGLIDSMRMHDGTGTHYAMKWGVALLDPSSSDDVTALANAGLAAEAFKGRPAAYSDEDTVKYIILMTDGQITEQVRPKRLPDGTINPRDANKELNEGRRNDRITITSTGTNVASFNKQCNLAKTRSPRPIVVYTIAFDAPGTPENQMRACASTPSHFYAADGSDGNSIAEVFSAIARQINQLRLTE